ncbi:hypothetical protein CYY_002681 [Polysphondylium violaceum]|uniref:Ubiquinone biosynthesis protein COQ4 homolog, mitochondrial n=1 Tax=Polysphondylium violaceum TaxID=133409 RepID=A0A8J4UUX3_9MYCE|nr:hypothetical protein CYY_002681 [Polysphondylium violaceum]
MFKINNLKIIKEYSVYRHPKLYNINSTTTTTTILHKNDQQQIINKKGYTTTTTTNKNKIQNNLFQKVLLTFGSAIVAFHNPARGDMVATLGEVTGGCAIKKIKENMKSDPIGREILLTRPRILESTYPANLHLLPETTFGGAYYKWMKGHGFSPDERTQVRMIEDDEDAYVMQRYREVHDFWHVLSGIDISVHGEIAVKWLEMIQTGLPSTALSSFVGPLSVSWQDKKELINDMIPWAIRCGRNCKPLMNIKYEDYWETDLNEFRKILNFEPYISSNNNNSNKNE